MHAVSVRASTPQETQSWCTLKWPSMQIKAMCLRVCFNGGRWEDAVLLGIDERTGPAFR
jgi:hypothetical protein